MKSLFWACFLLLVIGGINWGLVGLFDYNLVEDIFGDMHFVKKVIYGVIGVAGVLALPLKTGMCKK